MEHIIGKTVVLLASELEPQQEAEVLEAEPCMLAVRVLKPVEPWDDGLREVSVEDVRIKCADCGGLFELTPDITWHYVSELDERIPWCPGCALNHCED